MNPNLCFEYQQLMLRYNEKNKASSYQKKNTEMRSKSTKQRIYHQDHHEEKINKVFENAKSVENSVDKNVEKVETKKNNNVSKNQNKKTVFKLFDKLLENKNLENKSNKQAALSAPEAALDAVLDAALDAAPDAVPDAVPDAAPEAEPESAPPTKNKNINISKICKALAYKKNK